VFALWFVARYALRFNPGLEPTQGFRLGGAGSRGCGFFDISICAGDLL